MQSKKFWYFVLVVAKIHYFVFPIRFSPGDFFLDNPMVPPPVDEIEMDTLYRWARPGQRQWRMT